MKSFKSYITESTSDLFKKLDSAVADEYTAIIQYTAGAEYTSDEKIKAEFMQHAREEYEHIISLLKIISDLGYASEVNSSNVSKKANVLFIQPEGDDNDLLDQNLEGEHDAVKFYTSILNNFDLSDKHNKMIQVILDKEEEHIKDLKKL